MRISRQIIDRYPAKMVGRLANRLAVKYLIDCDSLFDPFCGSGAVLAAAAQRGIPVAGVDVNPYAILLTKVKLEGFDVLEAAELCDQLLEGAEAGKRRLPVEWPAKCYWFTDRTLEKYERIRYVGRRMELEDTPQGRAVLLAYSLSVRRCSRADQRSPKPFISRRARELRQGRHFDPFEEIRRQLHGLSRWWGGRRITVRDVVCADLRTWNGGRGDVKRYSHIVTSPPYINAQDYFRNFKLELYLLAGLVDFNADELKVRFVGRERGTLLSGIGKMELRWHRQILPNLVSMELSHPHHAAVVHRYLTDMMKCFERMAQVLDGNGLLVLVCGDNLVGGHRILTWRVLSRMLLNGGFALLDRFGDRIVSRSIPPARQGHKGLIKQEVVSAFRRQ